MKNKGLWISGIIILLVIVAVVLFNDSSPGQYDEFVQCLTDNGAKVYGTYWGSYSQAQKAMFEDSWDRVNYIECSLPDAAGPTDECIVADAQNYPTWEFKDGSRLTNILSLEQLSEITGCSLERVE